VGYDAICFAKSRLRGVVQVSRSERGAGIMRTVFVIEGPREVPFYQGKAGRTITDDNVREFWKINAEFGSRKGAMSLGFGQVAASGLRMSERLPSPLGRKSSRTTSSRDISSFSPIFSRALLYCSLSSRRKGKERRMPLTSANLRIF
jgi:hypothetical protein